MPLGRVWVRRGLLSATGLLVVAVGVSAGLAGSPGSVGPTAAPPDYVGAIIDAATACPALQPARLAGQIMEESGFNPDAVNGRGGRGLSGLSDEVWAAWRPNEQAARLDPVANIRALAYRTCDLVGQVRVSSVDGDPWELALGAAFADVATVKAAGGVPIEARDYVERILHYTAEYEQFPDLAPSGPPPVALTPLPQLDPTASASPSPSPTAAVTASTGSTMSPVPGTPTTTAPPSSPQWAVLVSAQSGLCLTATASGAQLTIWPCTRAPNQQWTVGADGTLRTLGLCMDAAYGSTANQTKVQVAACNGKPGQKFRLNSTDDLILRDIACVDVVNSPTASGSPVVLYSCNGWPDQTWYFA